MARKKLSHIFLISLLITLILPNTTALAVWPTPTPEPTTEEPVVSTPSKASATPTPSSQPSSKSVRTLDSELLLVAAMFKKNDFKSARTALLRLDKEFTNNADINNLLGFSSRKLKDYRSSATYYSKALRINPNHLGALEYQGELFITTKKISDAKKNLQKLKNLCGVNCEEYKDLKKAIGNL